MANPIPKFGLESLAQVRASGVEQLLRQHWREVAHFTDIPLDPDWDAYQGVENVGRLRIFTVRIDDELVGYAAYFINRNPHYRSSLQAVQDVLFLAPEHRKFRIGYRLIMFADTHLAAEGVQAVYQHSKVKKELDMGPLLARQGYELIDTLWAKRLDRG